jgi:hypothetical protein
MAANVHIITPMGITCFRWAIAWPNRILRSTSAGTGTIALWRLRFCFIRFIAHELCHLSSNFTLSCSAPYGSSMWKSVPKHSGDYASVSSVSCHTNSVIPLPTSHSHAALQLFHLCRCAVCSVQYVSYGYHRSTKPLIEYGGFLLVETPS